MDDRTQSSQPNNDAWWESGQDDWFPPPDDVPILAPYARTRPGFEFLRPDACEPEIYRDQDFHITEDGYYRICLWDIWVRDRDPADDDEEKQRINGMQRALGELSDDTRYIRLQIACVRRCFWTFPRNIDVVLDGVARGAPALDDGVSCEPPWSLSVIPVLRHRRGQIVYRTRYQTPETHYDLLAAPLPKLVRTYMTILMWWSFGGDLGLLKREVCGSEDLAETIYRRLGKPTRLKLLHVGKLLAAIGNHGVYGSRDLAGMHTEVWEAAIERELGARNDAVGGLIGWQDLCHHAFFRHLDRQIASIGVGTIVSLPGSGNERGRIHREVTNYVHALGSWLAGKSAEKTTEIWPACDEAAHRIYGVLGDGTPTRRWLVACLWKKLQETHREHGRGALDDEPERFAVPPEVLA